MRSTSAMSRGAPHFGRRPHQGSLAMALAGALLLMALTLAGCGTQAGDWRLLGPRGARTYCVVADPHESGFVYACASNGAVYRAQANSTGIAVAGEGIPLDAIVASVLPDPRVAGRLLAGTTLGLYRSDDYGAHWRSFSSGLPTGVAALALASTPDDAVLLAGVDGRGVYRSADDGTTWTSSAAGLPANATVVALQWDALDHLWWAGVQGAQSAHLYASADGGITWASRAGGIPSGASVNALAQVSLSESGSALFAATTTGLYRSADAGQRWSLVGGGLPAGSVLALATWTAQPTWIYAAIGKEVYTSTDAGVTWAVEARGLSAEPQGLAVATGKNGNHVVFAAADELARYPTGITTSSQGSFLVIGLIVIMLLAVWFFASRRRTRYGTAMGASSNATNTGRAAQAANTWLRSPTAGPPESAQGNRPASTERGAADGKSGSPRVSAPTKPTPQSELGAPAKPEDAAQNGHGHPVGQDEVEQGQ